MNYMLPSYSMTLAPKAMYSSLTSAPIGLSSITSTSGGIVGSAGNIHHISVPSSSSSNNRGPKNFSSSPSSNRGGPKNFSSSTSSNVAVPKNFSSSQSSSVGVPKNFSSSSSSNSGGLRNFSCEICHKTFPRQGNLDRHRRTHDGNRPFSCDLCPKAFSQRSHLKVHRNTHTGEQSFKCHVCGYCFSRNGNLTRHMRTHQRHEVFANENLYNPNGHSESGSKTDGKTHHRAVEKMKTDDHSHHPHPHQTKHDHHQLHQKKQDHHYLHQNQHHHHHHHHHHQQQQQQQQQSYKCTICSKSFTPSHLHGSSTTYCETCWKTVVNNTANTHSQHTHFHTSHNHLDQSSYEHPTKSKKRLISAAAAAAALHKYQCQLCGRTFPRNGNLERHKSAHLGLKPFSCDICGRMFGQKSHAKVHKMTHTGERPYKCDVCGFSFSRNGNLARHKRFNKFSCLMPGTQQQVMQPSGRPFAASDSALLPPPPLPPLPQLPPPPTPPPPSQREPDTPMQRELPLNVPEAPSQSANLAGRTAQAGVVVQVEEGETQQLEPVSNTQTANSENPDDVVDHVDSNILNTPQMPHSAGEVV